MTAVAVTTGGTGSTRRRVWGASAISACVALAVNLVRITTPEPWQDEGATWVANQRTLPELFSMLQHVDAVHGVYYLLIRAWQYLFGDSIGSTRTLSVVAVAIGAGLIALLAAELFGPPAALWPGLCYGVLPQATWAASEARSYAISSALTIATMLAFWMAVRRRHWPGWIAYAFLLALTVHLFLYSALAFIGLAVALPFLPGAVRLPAVLSTIVAAVACVPFVTLAVAQSKQVSWLANADFSLWQVLIEPFWGSVSWAGWLGLALSGIALTVGIGAMRQPSRRAPLLCVLMWLAAPSGLLLAASLVTPLYTPRYVTHSVSALALMLGFAINQLTRQAQRWLGLALVVAACVPAFAASRQPDAKASVAPAISELVARAQPGDGIYVVKYDVNEIWWAFEDDLTGLTNLSANSSRGWRNRTISVPSVPVAKIGPALDEVDRVWIFTVKYYDSAPIEQDLMARGFQREDVVVTTTGLPTTLVLMRRT